MSKGIDPQTIPPQTLSLSRLSWPLVLSTNYDNCYAAAFHKSFPERHLAIVGRDAEDCQRVLTSLSTAGRSLLWALQGYLKDLPYSDLPSIVTPDLDAQLVVGHEEYRRVTYRALHFRRAFAEVFRQRSLLFLGAGIRGELSSRVVRGSAGVFTARLRDPTMLSFRRARSIRISCWRGFKSWSWNIRKESTMRSNAGSTASWRR